MITHLITTLEIERMRLGIAELNIRLKTNPDGTRVAFVHAVSPHCDDITVEGTLPGALLEAFDRRQKQIADWFKNQPHPNRIPPIEKSTKLTPPAGVPAIDLDAARALRDGENTYRETVLGQPRVPTSTPFEPSTITNQTPAPYRCNVPMCGESGVCENCRKRGAR